MRSTTKSSPLALLVTGSLETYPVLKLPGVRKRIGPIKSASERQSTRVANALRAGYAVQRIEHLEAGETLLVCVPEARLPGAVAALLVSGLRWSRRVVLLAGGMAGSDAFDSLAEHGASVASLHLIDDGARRFFVEGDRQAARTARALLRASGAAVTQGEQGSHYLCAAMLSAAGWLALPMVDAAAECMRRAGLTAGAAALVTEQVMDRSIRAYMKGGRRAVRLPSGKSDRAAFLRQLDAVRRVDPALANYLQSAAVQSFARAGRSAAWLDPKALAKTAAGK